MLRIHVFCVVHLFDRFVLWYLIHSVTRRLLFLNGAKDTPPSRLLSPSCVVDDDDDGDDDDDDDDVDDDDGVC